jgi:hypothetical protein
VNDGSIIFQLGEKVPMLRNKRTLLDNSGQPVLNMKDGVESLATLVPKDKFTIYAGITSDKVFHIIQFQLNLIN